mmetsp:Transcript_65748/g.183114  ORF Transcript_65748/g.183114 Transcript_65748/m.183114 type:complete len:147 (-) Transcript_65748:1510-1950(-)
MLKNSRCSSFGADFGGAELLVVDRQRWFQAEARLTPLPSGFHELAIEKGRLAHLCKASRARVQPAKSRLASPERRTSTCVCVCDKRVYQEVPFVTDVSRSHERAPLEQLCPCASVGGSLRSRSVQRNAQTTEKRSEDMREEQHCSH